MSSIKLTFTPTAPRKLGTIFVVDDNPLELGMLMDYFDKYPGIEVVGFANGDECVKHIVMSSIFPDMILMDYFLDSEIAHSKDGLEILVKLKEICPNTAIIMHTGVENQRIILCIFSFACLSFRKSSTCFQVNLESMIVGK